MDSTMDSTDTARFAAPLPKNEAARQRSVDALQIVDTPRERDFDDLVGLAAAVCDMPQAAFTLLTEKRQWFKSEVGLDDTETHRDLAFCGYTILGKDPLVVEDTWLDDRFREHPVVLEGSKTRFYAGLPIAAPDGHAVGSLCVMDSVPRRLTPLALRTLRVLADQIQTQLALRASLRTQRLIAERKEELTQLIVHDLKSPLTAIGPNAQFIAMQSDGSVVAEAANEIAQAAERMHRMVLDVLDVSRSEGELPLQRSLVDVRELLRFSQAQFAARAQLSNIKLHIADGERLVAPLDRELLQRVLDNLIDNAIKYGRHHIDVSASKLDDETGGSIEVVVADDGHGIPLEARKQIFLKGQRLAMHAAQEAASSRGLGLCFCAMAVAAHGGSIVVDDNIPSGSRFVVRLPIVS